MKERSVWYIVDMCIMGLAIDVILFITLKFLYRSCNHYGCQPWISDKITSFSLMTMIVSLAYVTIDWYRVYYAFCHDSLLFDNWDKYIQVISDTVYYIATVLLYIALILRVYSIFKDTHYALSQKQLMFLACLIAFDVITIMLFLYSVFCALSSNTSDNSFGGSDSSKLVFSGITIIVNDILINFILLYTFFNKLYQMIQTLDETYQILINDIVDHKNLKANKDNINNNINNNHSDSENDANIPNHNKITITSTDDDDRDDKNTSIGTSDMTSNLEADSHSQITDANSSLTSNATVSESAMMHQLNRNKNEQNELIDLMSRILLLTIISILVEQVFTIMAAYNVYRLVVNDDTKSYSIDVGYWFREFEAVWNCLVLYFTFIFNENEYYCLCKVFHACLKNACIESIKKKLLKLRQKKKDIVKKFPTIDDSNTNLTFVSLDTR